jgi:hypothetical protein
MAVLKPANENATKRDWQWMADSLRYFHSCVVGPCQLDRLNRLGKKSCDFKVTSTHCCELRTKSNSHAWLKKSLPKFMIHQ